mgnify:FL=1
MTMKSIKDIIKNHLQNYINKKNRKRLYNMKPTIIASNCTGGFIYHWLGLQFQSPFINLYMTPDDFLKALENFEIFINTPIKKFINNTYDYPVGIGAFNTKIHFMHYNTFDEAIKKWEERKKRIDMDNMCVILSNWGGERIDQLERFEKLPFKNKVVFTDKEYPKYKSSFYLHGYRCSNGKNGNVYATQKISGKRFIDQFDYVQMLNRIIEKE